jgi:glutamine amidotransferase
MCELLGMVFNLPVRPNISFRGFRRRGKTNPHGWGIAFYPDESAQIIKEPIKAKHSLLSKFLQDYQEIKSKILVGHVRLTSVGIKSHKNTHPFQRELGGKDYVFAHNGTLTNYKNLELGRFNPIGETDSEHTFCYLLNLIETRGIKKWNNIGFDWLAEKLERINQYGNFNCIFSDGKFLFCYHDKKRLQRTLLRPKETTLRPNPTTRRRLENKPRRREGPRTNRLHYSHQKTNKRTMEKLQTWRTHHIQKRKNDLLQSTQHPRNLKPSLTEMEKQALKKRKPTQNKLKSQKN